MRQTAATKLLSAIALAALAVALLWPALTTDHRLARLAANTLWLVGLICLASVPIGTVLGFVLTRTDLPGRRAFAILLGLVLFVPLYLHAAAWQSGFGWDGWYTVWSGNVYRPPLTTDSSDLAAGPPIVTGAWIEGWLGAVIVHSSFAIPWVALIVGLGLLNTEGELEEHALLDTGPWGVFTHVTLRRGIAAVAVATLWVAIGTAAEMTVTDLFQIRTYAEELYTDLSLGTPLGETTVRALPGMLVTVSLVAVACLLASRLSPPLAGTSLSAGIVFPLKLARWPLSLACAAIVALVVGVPIGSLIYKAGSNVTVIDGQRIRGWSLHKLATLAIEAPNRFSREFYWSIVLAALTAVAAVLLGLALAWIARRGGWRGLCVALLCGFAAAVPGPLLGLAIIEVFNRPDFRWLNVLYDRTVAAPWLALTIRATPWTTLILWLALRSVSQESLEAAELDGVSAWSRFWRIAVPQRRMAVVLAGLVAAIIAVGDLAATILVVPPGVTTLSNRIFERLHYGAEDQVAGLCLVLVVGIAAFSLLAGWLARRGDGPNA